MSARPISETEKVQAVLAERMSGFPLVGIALGACSGGSWQPSSSVGDAIVGTEPTSARLGATSCAIYGGFLVAESVAPENRPTIAAARDTLAALVELYSVCMDLEDEQAEGRTQRQRAAFADRWVAALDAAEVAMSKAGGAL